MALTSMHLYAKRITQACTIAKGSFHRIVYLSAISTFFFTYALTGWDGSMADAALWTTARTTDLHVPDGKYVLGDAGFALSETTLVPFHGVCYHLRDWRQARSR